MYVKKGDGKKRMRSGNNERIGEAEEKNQEKEEDGANTEINGCVIAHPSS